MRPVTLRTERLLLDQPTLDDVDAITEHCQDPLFEQFMTLPSPYTRDDAEHWVSRSVPSGWAADTEYSWAIRERSGGPLIGAISSRSALSDIGYWLGGSHRRRGYMTEAVRGLVSWLQVHGVATVRWECVVGNTASAGVARAAGFRYTGTGPSDVVFRDGSRPLSWHGEYGVPTTAARPWPGDAGSPLPPAAPAT